MAIVKKISLPRLLAIGLSVCLVQGGHGAEERVGLVLSGGGARGVAHVGVIQALEEMRVPVHAIAATSMGALVGGMYATGMSAGDLREVVSHMDWQEAFLDKPDRKDLPVRRKQDDYDYPVKFQFSFNDGSMSFPMGVVQGQRATMLIKNLMVQAETIKDFDQLFIPFRALAADVETGDAYVFSEGDIVLAMRTSMSLPAIFAPVEHDGRLLVDGGIANNLPVDVARTMGVDKLIVVDIGTPMAGREEITSVLAVAGQMINMLTRRNTEVQLASLDDNDILVTPELGEVGTLDFEKYQTAYDRGYEAAIALRASLETLALDETAWDHYVASRPPRVEYDPPVEFIVIDNNSKISDELIRVRLNQQLGEPLDRKQLEQDMGEIYCLDYFESVDYELVTDAGNTGLVLKLREKTWGTDNFKLGLNLVNDLDGDSQFNIGVSYRQKGLNRLGAEWVARGQLGDTIILDSVFYQPIDYKSRFFVAPYLGYRDYDVSAFLPGESPFDDRAVGSWRVRRATLELDGGVNLLRNSQLRLGLYRTIGDYRIDIGTDGLGEGGFDEGGAVASYSYDRLDSAFFPTRGGYFYGQYAANRTRLGADEDFDRWQLQAIGALSFGAKGANTVIVSGRTAQSRNASNEPQNFNQLGGLFNMSGLEQNVASGKQMLFGMVQYQRRLTGQTLIPLSSPVYVGASLEQGNLWESRSDISTGDLRGAGSIYLAVDSPVGPVYVAYGRSGNAQQSIYLSLGWPFYSQDNSRR